MVLFDVVVMTNRRCRFNQWSGINSLAYFLPITFERNIGLSTELSLIIAGVLGVQYFFISWLYVPSFPINSALDC